ncbi:MAG: glycosyltransferase [Betaproteobacteria bacterium]|nr:glycosyltransferase [Betaproteobacteria bacterium]
MDIAETQFLSQARQEALATLLAPDSAQDQPALMYPGRAELSAAIGSLALGGAERIVLDWAASCARQYRARLVVLRDAPAEWPLPPGVQVMRLGGTDLPRRLETAGAGIAAGGNPVVLCHLLTADERRALARGGAHPVPVLHNAPEGWLEAADALSDSDCVIAVSRGAAEDLRAAGSRAHCAVIRHVPKTPAPRSDARREWRARWALPQDALVIGMIGAVKPQKAYPRALRVLAALSGRRDAYLVIIGGPIGRDGALAWRAVLAQAQRLGLERRVRLPGFVPGAPDCLPAFDLLLNTSRYEGLSIATLEALAAGLPVVASAVGGQGELSAPGLVLVPFAAPDAAWAVALDTALQSRPALPSWRGVPTHRLWTLFHLLRPIKRNSAVLFVTANLNAGGAQRSLFNLALALNGALHFEIAVCGNSSSAHFSRGLDEAGVRVRRSAASRDCFDHAEAILRHVVAGRFGTICFWNVDAKVKLLLAKALAATDVRLIDVSPGGYSFEEMDATRAFQEWIAFSQDEHYARLDRLVLKYRGAAPAGARGKVAVIPNGVPGQERPAMRAAVASPRIVVSGRIAPSKRLIEAIGAMRVLWREHPRVELHLLGTAEPRHADYAQELLDAIGADLGVRVFLHGAVFEAPERLARFTTALVLGEHQGCPNAVLEALAAGLPVVANDSGGTRELVVDGRTGLLLSGCDPREIAAALARVIDDAALARRLSEAGPRHVRRWFSMQRMVAAYRKLLTPD